VIAKDPQRWLAQDPAQILEALRDPRYAEDYLIALAQRTDDLQDRVPEILEAVEFADRKLEEDPRPASVGRDQDWTAVVSTGIDLISKLAVGGASFGADADRGWKLIERAARRREEPSAFEGRADVGPAEQAIYPSSMRALTVAFTYADTTTHPDSEPHLLLALIDETLSLEPPDGLHARSVIGGNLAWLKNRAPEWTRSRWSRLIGADAPAGLGPRTFDQYLEWGAPSRELLTEHQDLYRAAMQRVPDRARTHLLHALLWGLEGYDAATILELLAEADDTHVAEAIQWVAFSAFRVPGLALERAVQFWELALERDMPASTYHAVGWLAQVERLASETWLDLTLAATEKARGQLDQPHHVAERAAKHPGDRRAILIMAGLLGANLKLWYLEEVGRAGLQLLRSRDASTQTARDELREQLLKREFFDGYGDQQ
jgi:hypothetical protein